MAYDEMLAQRVRTELSRRRGITEKKMFGGIAFMVNGNMACGVLGEDLMVRVGPDAYEDALQMTGAREMRFTGRPMKGMVYVSPKGYRRKTSFEAWIARGLSYAKSLPAK